MNSRLILFLLAALGVLALLGAGLYGAGRNNTMQMAYAVCGVHEK